MKFAAVLAVLFVFVNLSEQIPQLINCPPNSIVHKIGNYSQCVRYDCDGQSDSVSSLVCAPHRCVSGTKIGYKQEDNSKVYPDCCGGPICAKKNSSV